MSNGPESEGFYEAVDFLLLSQKEFLEAAEIFAEVPDDIFARRQLAITQVISSIALGKALKVVFETEEFDDHDRAEAAAELFVDNEHHRVAHFNSIAPAQNFEPGVGSAEEMSRELMDALTEEPQSLIYEGVMTAYYQFLTEDMNKLMGAFPLQR